VGFGAAADIASKELAEETPRLKQFREHISRELSRAVPHSYRLGHPTRRLPGHLSIGVRGQEREVGKLLAVLDAAGVSVSAGSASSAHHSGEPSGVLLAMGFDDECARGLLRLSLRRFNTQQEVGRFLKILPGAVATLPSVDVPQDSSRSIDALASVLG
jgi:cysteine desulfurase